MVADTTVRHVPRTAQLLFPTPALYAIDPPVAPLLDDVEIVSRIQRGDRSAEEALFRRHAKPVADTLARLLGRTQEAEDLAQETFITALRAIGKLKHGGAVRTWLLRIAVRKAQRCLRKRRLLKALGLDSGEDDSVLEMLVSRSASPEDRAEIALLNRVLSELPAKERIAWMLRHVEGLSLDEIAESTGCSLATVKRRITAAGGRIYAHVQRGERA